MINYNQNSIKSNYIIGKLLSVDIILPRIVKDLEWNSVRVPSNCTRMPSNDFESDKHGKWCFLFARNNGSPRDEMGGAIQYPSLVSTSNRALYKWQRFIARAIHSRVETLPRHAIYPRSVKIKYESQENANLTYFIHINARARYKNSMNFDKLLSVR